MVDSHEMPRIDAGCQLMPGFGPFDLGTEYHTWCWARGSLDSLDSLGSLGSLADVQTGQTGQTGPTAWRQTHAHHQAVDTTLHTLHMGSTASQFMIPT